MLLEGVNGSKIIKGFNVVESIPAQSHVLSVVCIGYCINGKLPAQQIEGSGLGESSPSKTQLTCGWKIDLDAWDPALRSRKRIYELKPVWTLGETNLKWFPMDFSWFIVNLTINSMTSFVTCCKCSQTALCLLFRRVKWGQYFIHWDVTDEQQQQQQIHIHPQSFHLVESWKLMRTVWSSKT